MASKGRLDMASEDTFECGLEARFKLLVTWKWRFSFGTIGLVHDGGNPLRPRNGTLLGPLQYHDDISSTIPDSGRT